MVVIIPAYGLLGEVDSVTVLYLYSTGMEPNFTSNQEPKPCSVPIHTHTQTHNNHECIPQCLTPHSIHACIVQHQKQLTQEL